MLVTCEACGTLHVESLPAATDALDYDGYYSPTNLAVSSFISKRVEEIIAGFEPYRQTGRLLEIGFGAGAMLHAAARAGWEAAGTEISRTAADHGRAQGLDVFCGELSEAGYADGRFDVVIASELLEHVSHPGELISEVARILRPGGLLWATTPNIRGLSSRLLGLNWTTVSPDHLHLFSPKGITCLLQSAGFRRVRIDSQGVNPFELWHALLHRDQFLKADPAAAVTARVTSGLGLNESLSKSGPGRAFRKIANEFLRLSRLGDSLKVWAER